VAADPNGQWSKSIGRCTVRTTTPITEWELGFRKENGLPMNIPIIKGVTSVADTCAAACAGEADNGCTGFDVMLDYDYPSMSQCRIYGSQSKLVVRSDWKWFSDQRNDGWPKDVINGADGTLDTFCAYKTPK